MQQFFFCAPIPMTHQKSNFTTAIYVICCAFYLNFIMSLDDMCSLKKVCRKSWVMLGLYFSTFSEKRVCRPQIQILPVRAAAYSCHRAKCFLALWFGIFNSKGDVCHHWFQTAPTENNRIVFGWAFCDIFFAPGARCRHQVAVKIWRADAVLIHIMTVAAKIQGSVQQISSITSIAPFPPL